MNLYEVLLLVQGTTAGVRQRRAGGGGSEGGAAEACHRWVTSHW